MPSAGLSGTVVSAGEVEAGLREAYPWLRGLRLARCSDNLTGVGEGFVSHVIRVECEWEGDPAGEVPRSVVVKVPTVERVQDLFSYVLAEDVSDDAKSTFGNDALANLVPLMHNKANISSVSVSLKLAWNFGLGMRDLRSVCESPAGELPLS